MECPICSTPVTRTAALWQDIGGYEWSAKALAGQRLAFFLQDADPSTAVNYFNDCALPFETKGFFFVQLDRYGAMFWIVDVVALL